MKLLPTVAALVLLGFAGLVAATPGRVDSLGCHKSKKYGMHCHRETSDTTAAREKRLLRECRGKPNAGACLGYARK